MAQLLKAKGAENIPVLSGRLVEYSILVEDGIFVFYPPIARSISHDSEEMLLQLVNYRCLLVFILY